MYGSWALGGDAGLRALTALSAFVMLALLGLTLRELAVSTATAAAVVLCVGVMVQGRYSMARPMMLGAAALCATLYLCARTWQRSAGVARSHRAGGGAAGDRVERAASDGDPRPRDRRPVRAGGAGHAPSGGAAVRRGAGADAGAGAGRALGARAVRRGVGARSRDAGAGLDHRVGAGAPGRPRAVAAGAGDPGLARRRRRGTRTPARAALCRLCRARSRPRLALRAQPVRGDAARGAARRARRRARARVAGRPQAAHRFAGRRAGGRPDRAGRAPAPRPRRVQRPLRRWAGRRRRAARDPRHAARAAPRSRHERLHPGRLAHLAAHPRLLRRPRRRALPPGRRRAAVPAAVRATPPPSTPSPIASTSTTRWPASTATSRTRSCARRRGCRSPTIASTRCSYAAASSPRCRATSFRSSSCASPTTPRWLDPLVCAAIAADPARADRLQAEVVRAVALCPTSRTLHAALHYLNARPAGAGRAVEACARSGNCASSSASVDDERGEDLRRQCVRRARAA